MSVSSLGTPPLRDVYTPQGGRLLRAEVFRSTGFVLAVGGAVFKAITTLTPLPGWELDPLVVPVPHTGLGSGGSMLVDHVILIGALCILIGDAARGARLSLTAIILLLLGGSAVIISGTSVSGEPHVAHSWIASMTLGVAMFHLCRDDRYKRLVLAALAGFVIILAVRGTQQVIIEHPQTMLEYRQNRERFLDAQGWTHDSPMAKSYERRISQNEATGWFGLANVYATFAAGGATAGTVLVASSLLVRRKRRRERNPPAPDSSLIQRSWLAIIPAAGFAALFLADAKGGLAACFLGIGFATLTAFLCSRRSTVIDRIGRVRLGMILSLGTLAVTLSLVIVRGLIGTRLGELSLLFRWFYLDAAARIGLHDIPFGCGADGFKPMYALFKNPLSPENVSSSHNILSDFWACGGIFASAWIVLWVWWIAAAGRVASNGWLCTSGLSGASRETVANEPDVHNRNTQRSRTPPADGSLPSHQLERASVNLDFRLLAAVGVAATLLALRLETPIMTPDLALARVIGLLAWCGIAWLMISSRPDSDDILSAPTVRFALSAAAVAMGAHALIDQAGVWPSSAPMLMAFLGAAAAGLPSTHLSSRKRPQVSFVVIVAIIFAGQLYLGRDTRRVLRWERLMIRAAEVAHPAAEVSIAWQNISTPRAVSMSQMMTERRELRASLEQLTGHVVKDAPDAVQAAVEEVVRDRIQQAIADMTEAYSSRPGHFKTQRELSRLELALGQRFWLGGDRKNGAMHLNRALSVALQGLRTELDAAPYKNEEATYYGWAAVVYQSRFELMKDPAELRDAVPVLERAAKLDPYGLEYPKRLMLLHVTLGNTPEAVRWAHRTLKINDLQRLDQDVQGLRESERAEALRLTTQP